MWVSQQQQTLEPASLGEQGRGLPSREQQVGAQCVPMRRAARSRSLCPSCSGTWRSALCFHLFHVFGVSVFGCLFLLALLLHWGCHMNLGIPRGMTGFGVQKIELEVPRPLMNMCGLLHPWGMCVPEGWR